MRKKITKEEIIETLKHISKDLAEIRLNLISKNSAVQYRAELRLSQICDQVNLLAQIIDIDEQKRFETAIDSFRFPISKKGGENRDFGPH